MAVDTKRRLAQCRRTSAVGGGPEMATDCQTGAFDPTATSPLRYAGQAHTLKEALAPRKEGRIVTHSASSTANVESWIERKPCLCPRASLSNARYPNTCVHERAAAKWIEP